MHKPMPHRRVAGETVSEEPQTARDGKGAFNLSGEPVFRCGRQIVAWAERVFEEGKLYVRVRFTNKTELCWTLQTAHVILEADLSDCKIGNIRPGHLPTGVGAHMTAGSQLVVDSAPMRWSLTDHLEMAIAL
jgi:hypothetical protein